MSESKHTPGPWTIIPACEYDGDEEEFHGAYVSPASIEGADGAPVCTFGSEDGSGTLFENEANMHLASAAPDLLALAKEYEAWEADIILNADWRNEMPRLTHAQYDRMLELQAMRNAAIAKAEGRS